MSAERYKKAISAALEIHRLREEIQKNLDILAENITAREAASRTFDNDAATDALKLVGNIQLKPCWHIQCSLLYFEVDIPLHCDPAKNGAKAMKQILENVKIS